MHIGVTTLAPGFVDTEMAAKPNIAKPMMIIVTIFFIIFSFFIVFVIEDFLFLNKLLFNTSFR